MGQQLPPLQGYNQQQAEKIRLAYIRFLNTATPAELRVSRLDFGVQINSLERQLKRRLLVDHKYDLEDMFYDKYLIPTEKENKVDYIIKENLVGLGFLAIEQMTTTAQWLGIKSRAQSYELLFRCLFYDFKRSDEVKAYLKTIPFICPIKTESLVY